MPWWQQLIDDCIFEVRYRGGSLICSWSYTVNGNMDNGPYHVLPCLTLMEVVGTTMLSLSLVLKVG